MNLSIMNGRRCQRLNKPISLAMLDLDHFKLLNDTYGHHVGDECLKAVSQLLKKTGKRPDDICARYGGEEFVIVYGGTLLEQATVLVRKLLHEISSLNIPNKNSPTSPILTASVGIATMYPNSQNNVENLIIRADELLYLAKKNGRNRISTEPENYKSA